MPHAISSVYLDVQQARASAVLAAAGAWDATPLELACPGFNSVTLTFTYTRGGAAGAFDWQIQPSPYSVAANVPAGAQEWSVDGIYAAGVVAAGGDTTSLVQRELQSYTALGAAVETFVFGPVELDGTIERIRVPCRESGNLGAPGLLQIQASFGSEV